MRQADVIGQTTEIRYFENEPKKYSRSHLISLFQSFSTSFGEELVYAATGINLENQFHNLWGVQFNYNALFPYFETRELRGGPALWMNPRHEFASHFNTNRAKDFSSSGGIHYTKVQNEVSRIVFAHIDFNWYPVSRFRFSPFVGYTDNINEYQYILTIDTTTEIRYLMGHLKQKTLEITLRAELFFTPELSLQFYGSPYFSSGHYAEYYFVSKADAKATAERFAEVSENYSVSAIATDDIQLLELNSGKTYTIDNPDFSFAQFRSNLVFRWEYKLGSVFYFIWSHNQTFDENVPYPALSDSLKNLSKVKGKNIFLVKLNYWFSI